MISVVAGCLFEVSMPGEWRWAGGEGEVTLLAERAVEGHHRFRFRAERPGQVELRFERTASGFGTGPSSLVTVYVAPEHFGHHRGMPTELLYLHDAFVRTFDATVVDADETGVALERTAFYVTGGGQPHDTGVLRWEGGEAGVVDVRKRGDIAWHSLEGDVPAVGSSVSGEIDWDRRHALMRTHTALHVLCGVIWNTWGKAVTGGDMQPLAARMDFEFDPLPPGFAADVEERVNAELAAARPVEVSFLPRDEALGDADLIRTKVNLIPETVTQIRVVDIVGLDKQADGGTHVRNTAEVGRIRVVKTESKGKGNKRIRIEVLDA